MWPLRSKVWAISGVIDTSKLPLYETVMELTNDKGADATIDSVGGASGNELGFCVLND